MTWKKGATTLGTLIAGALGGAVAASILVSHPTKGQSRGGRQHPFEIVSRPSKDSSPNEDEITALSNAQTQLDRRLADLEKRPTQRGTEVTPTEKVAPAPTQFDSAAELDAIRARHNEWRDRHANEFRDSSWAREEESAFNEELLAAANRGRYKVIGVDCRTTLCTAELEWASYADASRHYRLALHVNIPGCESSILLEPPTNPTRPYRATARYDCEEARAAPPN